MDTQPANFSDPFRPTTQPASVLYDALQREASFRRDRTVETWLEREALTMWSTARDYAQQYGLRVPTLKEVTDASDLAAGHVDYAAKWSYYITDLLKRSYR